MDVPTALLQLFLSRIFHSRLLKDDGTFYVESAFLKENGIKTTSITSAKNQHSKTIHEKEKLILTPQETMDLGVGEFLGSVSASDAPFFRMNLSPIGAYHPKLRYEHFKPLPITTRRIDAQANFQVIRHQVREIMRAAKEA